MMRYLFALLVLVSLVGCGGGDPAGLEHTAGTDTQQERKELIEGFKLVGVIDRVDALADPARVYVLPGFTGLGPEDRDSFVSVCYVYAYGLPLNEKLKQFTKPMGIYNAESGEALGSYSFASGVVLD